MEPEQVRIKFLAEYEELFNPRWRNIVFYGGRSSGKSQHVAIALILRARTTKLRILCTRELQNTIADSVHKLLSDIINQHDFTDYQITDKAIRNTLTGSEFIFKGLRHNSTEIKSTEGIDIAWVEEAQSISEASLKVLVPTIRKPGSQLIFTFNRLKDLDPVYVRYVQTDRARTYVRKVNYDVLERAGLMPDEMREEMEADKRASLDLFTHIWLGEPQSQADEAVISRSDILSAMERTIEAVGAIEVGVDVARMGDDRTVFAMRHGMKLTRIAEYTKLRTTEVCDKLEYFVNFNKEVLLKIDDTGVGSGVTDEMIRRSYRVMAINFGESATDKQKYPNLISEAWFHLQEIMGEVELPRNDELMMELSTRHWRQDNKGRRGIESKEQYKKRGYRSPDLADAVIMCFYNRASGPFRVSHREVSSARGSSPLTSGLLNTKF